MNERITELADQAGLGIRHDGIVLTKDVNAAEALNQFAQLIAKECIDIAKDTSTNGFSAGRRMQEHFGIESRSA